MKVRTANFLVSVTLIVTQAASTAAQDEVHEYDPPVLKDDLARALAQNDYGAVSILSGLITSASPTLFREAIKEAVHRSLDEIRIGDFIRYFQTSHGDPAQSAQAFIAALEELDGRSNSDNATAVTLAFNFRRAHDEACAPANPRPDECAEVKRLAGLMNRNLRLLAFLTSVCVQSTRNREFLHAVEDSSAGGTRRRLRTLPKTSESQPVNDSWIVEPYGEALHIRNAESNEYVSLAREYYDFEKDRIHVELRGHRSGWDTFDSVSEWLIEPYRGAYYIKNPRHKSGLFVNTGDDDKNYVYASHASTENSLWRLYQC